MIFLLEIMMEDDTLAAAFTVALGWPGLAGKVGHLIALFV